MIFKCYRISCYTTSIQPYKSADRCHFHQVSTIVLIDLEGVDGRVTSGDGHMETPSPQLLSIRATSEPLPVAVPSLNRPSI